MAKKKKRGLNHAIITIELNGAPSPPSCFLDPGDKKHPSKVVFWALDPNQQYEIVFSNGTPFTTPSPYLTSKLTGATPVLHAKYPIGQFLYDCHPYPPKKSKKAKAKGAKRKGVFILGGIIIDG